MADRRGLAEMGLASVCRGSCRAGARAVLAGVAGLILTSAAALAQVVINPVVVELGARQRAVAVTVTLSEKASAPMRLQAELKRWQQDLAGADITEPSDDLLVTPPIADVRPGEKQIFRIALRGARPDAGELAYRLILEDINEPTGASNVAPGMAISFRMRYDLPVLLAPVGPVLHALHWKPCPTEAAGQPVSAAKAAAVRSDVTCLRIANLGNRRVKIRTLLLAGDGWQQSVALKDGVNVLAGAQREWHLPLQPGQAGALRSVSVQTVQGETLQAESGGY